MKPGQVGVGVFCTLKTLGDDLLKFCACKNQRTHKLRTMRLISAKWGDKSSVFHQFGFTNMQGRAFLAQGGKNRLEKLQMDLFSSTQCDTYIHYACITCITCYLLVKKATQSRAI